MSDLITISSSVLPRSVRVLGFRGTEAISRPYEVEIFLVLPQELGEEFDLADAVGAKAKLVLDRGQLGVPPFVFAGVFANVEVIHAYDAQIVLRALLVPRLWQLGLGKHSRIFTKMSVPDIIKAILDENGVTDHELRLGAYEVEEHVCQYRESDLDFISRWMEREGIFYFFEQSEDGEKLILADQGVYDEDPLGRPVRYYPQFSHDHSAGAAFRAFTCRHSTLPASVRLKDYDYAKPNLNVSGTAKVALNGTGEVSLYGERFFTPSAGDRLARIRSEELLAKQAVFRGAGNRLHLRPGYTFEVEEHPFPSFNTRYVAFAAHHAGNQAAGHPAVRELLKMEHADVYEVEVDAILAKVQLRAESVTPWPRIYGYENGIVDGPADSEYAQIDEQGRYNAKFKFDESTLKNGKATTWVRMMQPHGGDIEGFHFPLRKGTEVVFSFLGGDPDRPVISGVVPNMVNPSPVTAANYTRNVIQTGSRNRMEMEDKAGSEWVRWSTPYAGTFLNMGLAYPAHEVTLHTNDNIAFDAQQALDVSVAVPSPAPSGAGNMTVHVLNNLTTTVDNVDMKTTVSSGNAYHTVSAGTFTELVQSDVLLTYNATKTEHVDDGLVTETFLAQKTTIATTQDVKTGAAMTITSGGLHTVNSKASYKHTVTGDTAITTSGETHIHSTGEIIIDTPANITMKGAHVERHSESEEWTVAGVTVEHMLDNHISFTAGMTVETKAAVVIELTAALNMAITLGASLELDASLHYEASPFHQDLIGVHTVALGSKIITAGEKLHMGGVASYLVGLMDFT
jgi:type VI secretion system secreted protein VgrG